MALGDLYKAVWSFTHPNGDGELSFSMHYELTAINVARSEAEYCQDLGQTIEALTVAQYLPLLPTSFEFQQVDVQNQTQPAYGNITPSGVSGSDLGEAVPIRSSPIISKRTGLRGRSRRGRMYLMAPVEGNQNAGELLTAYKTSLQNFVDQLKQMTATSTNVYDAVVYSSVLLTHFPIVAFLVRDNMGSVRKRQVTS